ncbi:MAG: hypothetical protein IJW34_07775 [Clostridia bacterium]|nr:hypothetical protein [Clostridia bacterium]
MKKSKGNIYITIWLALGITIILTFFVFSMVIGGSAGNGYREAGKYFVGDHGNYVEVSQNIWIISSIWEILYWIFIPLTPLGAFVISAIQEKIDRKRKRLE